MDERIYKFMGVIITVWFETVREVGDGGYLVDVLTSCYSLTHNGERFVQYGIKPCVGHKSSRLALRRKALKIARVHALVLAGVP